MAIFGDTLRQARAHKGVTLKEAEQKTRINRHHLLALEEERFHELPALIYQRGIVKSYGSYLELDPLKLLGMFEDARGIDPAEERMLPSPSPVEMPNHWAPNFAIIAFLVVMSAVVFAWMYSVYFAPAGETSTPTEVIPTVTPLRSDTMFEPSAVVLPSATAAATADVSPSATKKPKAAPTATATAEIIVGNGADSSASNDNATSAANSTDNSTTAGNSTDAGNVTAASDAGNSAVASSTEAASNGALSFDFTATGDIQSLTVVVDGNTVFDQSLATGDETGYLVGKTFDVHVSDPSSLKIYEDGGAPFDMGNGEYFSLP